jgi:hypothetical protein
MNSSRASSITPASPAHRQPAGQERPPPVRNRVQGLRPRAAHGGDARPAPGRRHAVHQGGAVSFNRAQGNDTRCHHRLRHGQPAFGGQGDRACRRRKPTVVVTADPAEVLSADRVVFPGQGAMPDCMRELDARGLRPAVLEAARNKPFLGICIGSRCCSSTARRATCRPRRLQGRSRAFPRQDGGCRRRAPEGAAHGLERGLAEAGPPAVGRASPTAPASISCTATMCEPAIRPWSRHHRLRHPLYLGGSAG